MGTTKEEIARQKEQEILAAKVAQEEQRQAEEARGEQEKLWAKMTESQRKAQEAGPGDFQKIIDEQVAKTKGDGAKETQKQAEQQAAGTKETVKEVGAVGEAVKEGSKEVAAAVGEVVFPDCIALCDETIERLGAYFVKEKSGAKMGPQDPLPFMFPGQTGWEIKEGFKIPKFRGGAAVGGAIALTHEEKMALGLIKKEEGGQDFQGKAMILEYLEKIEEHLFDIEDFTALLSPMLQHIYDIRKILEGGNLGGRSPIYSDAVAAHLAAIVEAAERNVRQNGAIGGALHIDLQKNNDLLTKILATLKRIEWYNKEYMGRVAANTAHMQMSEFTPIAPISTNKMAGNLKGCCAAVHNIDRNITAIEKRLRGCITNQ